MPKIIIHHQDKSSSKYKLALFEGDEREILRDLLRWSLYVLCEDGTRELIVPHRVTGVTITYEA